MVLMRTSDTTAEAELRLDEIKQAVEAPPQAAARNGGGSGGGGGSVWKKMLVWPTKSMRRILVRVVGVLFFQQATGIDAIVLYSPLVFQKSGMLSNSAILGATIAVGVVKTSFILVATLFSDRVGRRPLLLGSAAGVAVTLVSLGLTLCVGNTSTVSTAACVASVLVFVAAFSIGFGPLAPANSSEIIPLRLRAQGTSLGTVVNRVTCPWVTVTFISLADWITMPGCFFLYAGMAVAVFMFVYLMLLETSGRSLEDMDVLFAAK